MSSFVTDFFKQLFMSRVEGAKNSVKGKAYNVQARTKGKIAGTFNKAVDGGIARVSAPVKGAANRAKGGGGGKADAPKQKGKGMGFLFFGKKNKGAETQPDAGEEVAEAKTQAINIAQFDDTQFKPCVGWVVIIEGLQKGRDFRLVAGRNRIGTDADMEVVLTDPYCSSHHATIVFTDEGIYQISDAGSTNGTRVNGKKVMQAQIVDNDTLMIGHTELRFKALD